MAITVTLSTLRADVLSMLDDANSDIFSTALVDKMVNRSLTHCRHLISNWSARPFSAKDTVSLVADTREYAIDKEIRIIDKVTVLRTDGVTERALTPVDFTDVERFDTGNSNSEDLQPTHYYRKANFIGFLPTPKAAKTAYVYSQKEPDDLSADGDTITAPPFLRNLITFKAASYCASAKGDRAAKGMFEADYQEEKVEVEYTLARWQQHETDKTRPLWDVDWNVSLLG